MSIRDLHDWTKQAGLIPAGAHLQEAVDAIRELQRQISQISDPEEFTPQERFLAIITNGPSPNYEGNPTGSDWADYRYYVKRILIFGSGPNAAVASGYDTMDQDVPGQVDVYTAINIAEMIVPGVPTASQAIHSLPTNETLVVEVFGWWDVGNPTNKHYFFSAFAPVAEFKIESIVRAAGAISSGRYTAKMFVGPTNPAPAGLTQSDLGTLGATLFEIWNIPEADADPGSRPVLKVGDFTRATAKGYNTATNMAIYHTDHLPGDDCCTLCIYCDPSTPKRILCTFTGITKCADGTLANGSYTYKWDAAANLNQTVCLHYIGGCLWRGTISAKIYYCNVTAPDPTEPIAIATQCIVTLERRLTGGGIGPGAGWGPLTIKIGTATATAYGIANGFPGPWTDGYLAFNSLPTSLYPVPTDVVPTDHCTEEFTVLQGITTCNGSTTGDLNGFATGGSADLTPWGC